MKTYIFVRNKKYRPSTFYRVFQYLDHSEFNDYELIEYESDLFYEQKNKIRIVNLFYMLIYSLIPGYIRRIKALIKISNIRDDYKIIIQRECFPRIIPPLGKLLLTKILKNACEVYWDLDDNIFDSKEISKYEEVLLNNYAKTIIVGNYFLKSKIMSETKVVILNTTDAMMENIDLNIINKERKKSFSQEIILIWVGTKSNIEFLKNIIPQLEVLAKQVENKIVRLKVISDIQLKTTTKYLIVENIKWNRELALKEMLNSHIGLMPLPENEITLGKCAFKAVQAIGCGLPVVVSNVGMNKEVIKKGNGILINDNSSWGEAIISIVSNFQNWEEKSLLSRELWLEDFNSEINREFLLGLLI
ncbi:glycosyltransferase [Paenibacillus sp. FSL L8-0506]|uniref:glycosyltransferase n=1 Tax=Paenibacillus sp. FSL L8-0506 TaxID=2975335 RepID=UPI0030F6746F